MADIQLPIEYQSLTVRLGETVLYDGEILYEDAPLVVGAAFGHALWVIIGAIEDPYTPDSAIAELQNTYASFCEMRRQYETDLLGGLITVRDRDAINVRTIPGLVVKSTPEENIAYRYSSSLENLKESIDRRYSGVAQ